MNFRQPPVMPDNSKIVALYERLSREDDELQGDSNSIVNQKKFLEDYAVRNGFTNTVHFTDDGYTGANFDRPDWKRLMDGVQANKIGTVIFKDMSRFGRDYLDVGYYMRTFRECGIRLIAVCDNVDTANGEDDLLPFRNIMNTWYLRDCSKKIKTAMRTKGMGGKRLTTCPIYGYARDPEDTDRWIIDPDAAEVVRRIYQMTIAGKGPHEIARVLTAEKVERPSYHLATRGIGSHLTSYDKSSPYTWNSSAVASIIAKPEYKGHTVNFRYYKDSYKDKHEKKNPKENWVIFENTHEAIIDEGTWETAQQCRKTVRRTDSLGEANPLTGKMFCADCGSHMYNHRKPHKSPHYQNPNTGKMYMRCPSDVYSCSAFDNAKKNFRKECTLHHIRTVVVRELVLDAIRTAGSYAVENEADFIKRVREASAIQRDEAARSQRKQLSKYKKRHAELNTLIKKLYEDNVSGKLSDKRFELLANDYESEQTGLEHIIEQIESELESFDSDGARADKFIDLAKKYTDFAELTVPMVNEFIEKILVHESDKSSGERVQQVDIYLNFIGKFDVPIIEPELTPEEIAEEEKKRQFKAKRREYERRYREKLKQTRLREAQIIE